MKYPFLLLGVFLSTFIIAQPQFTTLVGTIQDDEGKGIPYVAVSLKTTSDDKVVTGGLTNNKGKFVFDNVKPGNYQFEAVFMGFETFTQKVSIERGKTFFDLGDIALKPDNEVLDAVVVAEEKQVVNMQVDRKVFNVSKDISAQGGTGIDAVKNIPSVQVETDGSVTIRNSSPMIFVDGRPSMLTLEQIPADEIDRIEVITNPSAKFDASATGGILNVIMKQNLAPGYNGMITLGGGYPLNLNGMASLNVRLNKWNLSTTYSSRYGQSPTDYFSETFYLDANQEVTSQFLQEGITTKENMFQFGKVGLSYQANRNHLFTLEGNYSGGIWNSDQDQDYFFYDPAGNITEQGFQTSDQDHNWKSFNGKIGYRYQPTDGRQELMADFTYGVSSSGGGNAFAIGSDTLPNQPEVQDQTSTSEGLQYTLQIDYAKQVGDNTKWEIGLKSNGNLKESTLDAFDYDYDTQEWVNNPFISNAFRTEEWIHGVYVNYTTRIQDWGIQGGVRYEQSTLNGRELIADEDFSYNFPNGASDWDKVLFPSLYISKNFKKNHEFQLNVSRKINRPRWHQIMPFRSFTDAQTIREGNPGLQPEFLTNMEANHMITYKKGNFLHGVYGRYTDNTITNFYYPYESDSTILVRTYINGDNNQDYGYEATLQHRFNDKLSMTLNGNIYYSFISAQTSAGNFSNDGFSGFAKTSLRYQLPWEINAQIDGTYRAPRITPQGTNIAMTWMDLSFQKRFKNNLSLTLQVSDLFNSRKHGSEIDTELFTQSSRYRWRVRTTSVRLTWNFGKRNPQIFKNLIRRERGGSGGGEGEGF